MVLHHQSNKGYWLGTQLAEIVRKKKIILKPKAPSSLLKKIKIRDNRYLEKCISNITYNAGSRSNLCGQRNKKPDQWKQTSVLVI